MSNDKVNGQVPQGEQQQQVFDLGTLMGKQPSTNVDLVNRAVSRVWSAGILLEKVTNNFQYTYNELSASFKLLVDLQVNDYNEGLLLLRELGFDNVHGLLGMCRPGANKYVDDLIATRNATLQGDTSIQEVIAELNSVWAEKEKKAA